MWGNWKDETWKNSIKNKPAAFCCWFCFWSIIATEIHKPVFNSNKFRRAARMKFFRQIPLWDFVKLQN
ncbi:hypothetical protein D1970_15095 [Mesobacillus zeae]|uniref:Uncharacterized protein n=1 Tax=Mesobacillus zeae TaxID=1917180 RepID=A0A398B2D3_9BACI|nr:hypothetical protein D1970_15095 [Mesobacillus zeae]